MDSRQLERMVRSGQLPAPRAIGGVVAFDAAEVRAAIDRLMQPPPGPSGGEGAG